MSLSRYLERLARKHRFSLDRPGRALQVEPTESHYGPLMLCCWNDEEEPFAIGRVIFSRGKPTAGFTVWLDPDREAVRAVNDLRSNVPDLATAEAEMVELIERLYLRSNQAEEIPLP
jgi:hypothetical protein